MPPIKSIQGQKILDSSGRSTLEVTVALADGAIGVDSVPTGLHVGRYEVAIIDDITRAIANLDNAITPALIGSESTNQTEIDRIMLELDGSRDKRNLGGNTLLGVSLACARATANSLKKPLFIYLRELYNQSISHLNQSTNSTGLTSYALPTPIFNIIDGGKHADNLLSFQEFLVIPEIEGTFDNQLNVGYRVFIAARKILERMGQQVSVGEEGGYAPKLQTNEEALEILVEAIIEAGFKPKEQVSIGIDVAASAIPDLRVATYPYSPEEYYLRLIRNYPISFLEDPFGEDDWPAWVSVTRQLGNLITIVGDDLFSTNLNRLKMGIEQKAANCISIKPNQIGTLTEALQAIRLAEECHFHVMVSHRARETEDTFIADLASAVQAKYIKAGAQNRGERIAKYNQLLRIERALNRK